MDAIVTAPSEATRLAACQQQEILWLKGRLAQVELARESLRALAIECAEKCVRLSAKNEVLEARITELEKQ